MNTVPFPAIVAFLVIMALLVWGTIVWMANHAQESSDSQLYVPPSQPAKKSRLSKSELIYIATPFGSKDPAVKAWRLKTFCEVDGFLSNMGYKTVSPMLKVLITRHCDLPDSWQYWQEYCYTLLKQCDRMIVITALGWEYSPGVIEEIRYCRKHGIPIEYFNPYSNTRGSHETVQAGSDANTPDPTDPLPAA